MDRDLSVFKACSDETRLRILFLLAQRELCVCELEAVLEMPQGKISRHLAVLKHAGLVSNRRDGTWIYYSLREPETCLEGLLHRYLRGCQEDQEVVRADFKRFEEKVGEGTICVRKPRRI